MDKELNRFASFVNWPSNSNVSPSQMARSGLYYEGRRDEVVCFECKIRLDNWKDGENAVEKHGRLSPSCAFIGRKETTNRPLELAKVERVYSSDTVEFDEVYRSSLERANTSGLLSHDSDFPVISPIVDREYPDFEKLRLERARLDTFYDWPAGDRANPAALAREGFYYTGRDDRVQCVFCGGYLKRWVPSDCPVAEHRKHFSECPFVRDRSKVGNVPVEKFVNSVPEVRTVGDKKEMEDAGMETAAVRAVKEMGYSLEKIVEVRDSLAAKGNRLPNADHLLEELFRLEETAQQEHRSSPLSSSSSASLAAAEVTAAATITAASSKYTDRSFTTSLQLDESSETDKYAEENRQLREARTCKVCMEAEVNTVFLPCGHLVCCNECSSQLRDCPVCRTLIRGTVKAFLS